MPKGSHYWNFILVNLAFFIQISLIYYWFMLATIKKDWNTYRCNPMFMPFADDIEENFTYCIQNMQTNYMSYLLEPLNYLSSSLINIGGEFNTNINGIREMISVIRDFVTNIIQNVFGVFLNLVIEIQKMTISIKDLVGKIIGVVTVLLYVLSGSITTMESLWNGPPGQMVKALGKIKIKKGCFHPETKIKLLNDSVVKIKDIQLGDIISDGSVVEGVIKLTNRSKEHFYCFEKSGHENTNIYVTGDHFVELNGKYVKVKYYFKDKIIKQTKNMYSDTLYNLTTNTNNIVIGNVIFWDWDDDYL